jgi:hypothetical protein
VHGWADGGATRLSNLVLVCSSHHRMIHEGKLGSEVREGKIVFVDRRGRAMDGVPPSGASGRDLEELDVFLREVDVHVDASTTLSRWDGSRVALGEMLDWMLLAERGRSVSRVE